VRCKGCRRCHRRTCKASSRTSKPCSGWPNRGLLRQAQRRRCPGKMQNAKLRASARLPSPGRDGAAIDRANVRHQQRVPVRADNDQPTSRPAAPPTIAPSQTAASHHSLYLPKLQARPDRCSLCWHTGGFNPPPCFTRSSGAWLVRSARHEIWGERCQ